MVLRIKMTTKNSCRNIEKQILFYLNDSRKKQGLFKLKNDSGLNYLARRHSAVMAKRRKIWHGRGVNLAGEYASGSWLRTLKMILYPLSFFFFPFRLVFYFGDKGMSGENVAMMPKGRVKGFGRRLQTDRDLAGALHRSWMNSPGHQRNILNHGFTKIGIGIRRRGNTFYATELFYG